MEPYGTAQRAGRAAASPSRTRHKIAARYAFIRGHWLGDHTRPTEMADAQDGARRAPPAVALHSRGRWTTDRNRTRPERLRSYDESGAPQAGRFDGRYP